MQAMVGMDISVDSSPTTPMDHQRNHQLCKENWHTILLKAVEFGHAVLFFFGGGVLLDHDGGT
jgi:hypothetical protein